MGRQVEGPSVEGRNVVVLEDTSTTGGSALTAVEGVRNAGGNIVAVAVIVDRDTGAKERIEAEAGVPYLFASARTNSALAARPEHRHRGAHRQRVPGQGGPHHRTAPVEPPRRDGHRPLPARAPPPHRGGLRGLGRGRRGWPIIGIDNLPRSVPLETPTCPEMRPGVRPGGPGPDREVHARLPDGLSIAQFGSTRSINAGVAGGIAMHAWIRRHVFGQRPAAG